MDGGGCYVRPVPSADCPSGISYSLLRAAEMYSTPLPPWCRGLNEAVLLYHPGWLMWVGVRLVSGQLSVAEPNKSN